MHVYGGFACNVDYTGRLSVRMTDRVDGGILARALARTQQRYPYFLLRIRQNADALYYEKNDLPVVLLHTNDRIRLHSEEVNGHLWAVCYREDFIHLDVYHGMTDGTGMYQLLSTLLFYYCEEKYGVSDPGRVRTVTDRIPPEETDDPQDHLPSPGPPQAGQPQWKEAFTFEKDGQLTPSEASIWDIEIPENAFLRFTSANDASPGTMISLLLARAAHALYPDAEKDIISAYVVNARPMLGNPQTCHNCLSMVLFDYEDRIRRMPLPRQCTVYRGKTFIQSDGDVVRAAMSASAGSIREAAAASGGLSSKMETFGKMFAGGEGLVSFLVSYVGKWPHPALAGYIREFWTHPPNTFSLMAEIAAVNGNIFLSIQQRFREDTVREAFLRQLEEHGIPYNVRRVMASDAAGISL